MKVAEICKSYVKNAISTVNHPDIFKTPRLVGYSGKIRLGDNQVIKYDGKTILDEIKRHGPFELRNSKLTILPVDFSGQPNSRRDIIKFKKNIDP